MQVALFSRSFLYSSRRTAAVPPGPSQSAEVPVSQCGIRLGYSHWINISYFNSSDTSSEVIHVLDISKTRQRIPLETDLNRGIERRGRLQHQSSRTFGHSLQPASINQLNNSPNCYSVPPRMRPNPRRRTLPPVPNPKSQTSLASTELNSITGATLRISRKKLKLNYNQRHRSTSSCIGHYSSWPSLLLKDEYDCSGCG